MSQGIGKRAGRVAAIVCRPLSRETSMLAVLVKERRAAGEGSLAGDGRADQAAREGRAAQPVTELRRLRSPRVELDGGFHTAPPPAIRLGTHPTTNVTCRTGTDGRISPPQTPLIAADERTPRPAGLDRSEVWTSWAILSNMMSRSPEAGEHRKHPPARCSQHDQGQLETLRRRARATSPLAERYLPLLLLSYP